MRQPTSDTNNNTPKKNIRLANSHGNLIDQSFYISDDADTIKERKGLVKRTKSFWRFGKSSSDNEILEGMSLWRHRDLVDVEKITVKNKKRFNSQERIRRPSRDRSNDSDRTINAKQISEENFAKEQTQKNLDQIRHNPSFREKKHTKTENYEEEDFGYHTTKRNHKNKVENKFYDDDGDGLMLKTINRKNILQQYNNDSSASDSESESEITSDDPYDSILVEDQNVNKKQGNHFPNVAEIGKKLEKLSKSSKFSPNNAVTENNTLNHSVDRSSLHNTDEIMQYNEQRRSFKTFGVENQVNENKDNEKYFEKKRRNDSSRSTRENRRHYVDQNDKRTRASYESIDSDIENRSRRSNIDNNKRDKAKYYDSTNDELSDAPENRKFIPRTKLAKTNSNASSRQDDVGLMDYGETLQKRLKHPEYGSTFDEKSPHNGNMYGPWYDLWGLDASAKK